MIIPVRQTLYFGAALASGVSWAWIADQLGHTTETYHGFAVVVYYLAGAITGVAVSYLFRRLFRLRGAKFALLPFATLAFASQFFGVLHWIWLTQFHPVPLDDGFLFGVLTTFFVMTFISLLTPIFFGLALLNQWMMRFILSADYKRMS